MIIRPAVWTDAYAITALWGDMNLEVYSREIMREELANPKNFFLKLLVHMESQDWGGFVAEKDGKIIGFILAWVRWPLYNYCHLIGFVEAIYVDPNHRGNDVHRLLIEAAINKGKEKGMKDVEFMSVYSPGLMRYYESMGFEPVQIVYRQSMPDTKI